MKNFKLLFLMIGFMLAGIGQIGAQGVKSLGDDGVFYLRTSDGHEGYVVDGEVTFKAVASGLIKTSLDAGVCFSPKNEGDLIQVTFEDIDLNGTNTYLRLYHGYAQIKYPLPTGHFAQVGKEVKGQSYLSESADGKFTFGFHSNYNADGQTGWTIKVKSITPADMTYKSASVFLDQTSVNRGGRNQILLGVNVVTEGLNNRLSLKELNFGTTIGENLLQSYKIYYTGANKSFATDTKISESSNITSSINIATDVALANGNNYFWFVADIAPNAAVSSSLPVNLTSLKIGEETKTPEASSPSVAATISSDILMQKEHLSYTIGSDMNFFDDGGKNGNISSNFEGTITFVPSSVGKKIKIDFSKLELFTTSTVGYNDVFNFYNGQSVDAQKLITTLLKDIEPIKSTADDGAITITFKSTTGFPTAGWEAIVSEFVPEPMTYNSSEVQSATEETLAAGNVNERMLIFNIKTSNTLTPLAAEGFKFDATGTTTLSRLTKAKVYFLGKKAEFSTSNLVGEVSLSGSSTFEVTGSQSLIEGNNYFALTYDVSPEAINDEEVVAALSSVKLSGTSHTVTNSVQAKRKVDNTFKSLAGTHTRTLYGNWMYTDTKSPFNSSYYDYEDKDCIVTFTPANAGAVAEIEFSAFDVYYANASYGVKAVFEIYSGTAENSANLLWKLDDAAKSKTGPVKKLRSTAADGSITIKFNAKTTSSYYAGTGWKAAVRPYVNHDMTIKSISAFQTETSKVSPSATNQEIIGFEIVTDGTLNPLKTEEVKINLKKSLSAVDKVHLLYSGEVKDFSTALPIAELSPTTAQIAILAEQILPEEKSYFWISYDTKSDIESDQELDAELLSVKASGTTYTPVVGDPEGSRLTKNEIVLASGDNGQVTLNKTTLFYDDGGADNSYSKSFDGQITFLPAATGQVVKLKFNDFFTASAHYMYIYNGKEAKEENLLYKISSTTTPGTILSTSADGALTIRFVSTTTSTYRGWEIEASSYTLQDLVVKGIATAQVGDDNILRGANNEALQKIVVSVEGDKNVVKLNNLKFGTGTTTNAGDISSAKLFYTGKTSSFIAEGQYGNNATSSNLLFTGTQDIEISEAGDYYFWLAYDISKTATIGNKVSAKLESLSVGGNNYTSIVETTGVERTIKGGFKGTYTIGKSSSADYATFAAAIADMKSGVEGTVEFKVEAGTYNENILIKDIRGTSAENTITFTSASGKNNDVVIKGSGYSATSSYGMFAVDSTSYVTIENMSLIPTDQSYKYNMHIRRISRHFTLRNCILTANLITSGYSGMNHFYMESINEEGKNNDYVTVDGNIITGGYIALYMGGTGYVALSKEKGAVIRNNKIYNPCGKGIYIFDERDALVENNTIISETTTKTGYQGMDIYRNKGNLIIRNNKIVNKQSSYSTGIELRSEVAASADKPVQIYNNSISLTGSPNTSSYGMSITGDCSYVHYYNNTVRIAGNGGYPFGFYKTDEKGSNLIVQNNLFQNKTASPLYAFFRESQLKMVTFKNNAYQLTGSKFTNNFGGDDFATWVANSGETGAIEYTAEFFTDTDLHLRVAGNLNAALPVSFITSDIDGKPRSTTTPTIGAYEYVPFTIGIPEMEEDYPKVQSKEYNNAALNVKLTQPGKLYSLIKPATDAAPSVDDIKAGQKVDLGLGEEGIVTFSGLTELTDYKAYFYMESIFGDNSAIMSSELFKTPVQIHPMVVTLPREWDRVEAGKSVNLFPIVTGGVYPYTYSWKNAKGEQLSTDSILTVAPQFSAQYTLTVKDSNVENKDYRTDVLVTGNQAVATFDDLYLASESYWQGFDDEELSVFYSGSYSFSNMYYPSLYTWGGFSYSNVTNTNFNPAEFLTQQFRSVTGEGVEGSKNFAVLYTMGSRTEVKVENNPVHGEIIPGVFLTNAAYTMSSIKKGDSFTGDPFKKGDWAKVTFKGTKADGTTSSLDYYFADYRSENEAEHYAIDTWRWVDLSSLGQVVKVGITIDASRKDAYGLTLPAYICMDNFGATDPTPIIADGYPVLKGTTRNTASFEMKADNAGKLYKYAQKATDTTTPDLSTILASGYDEIEANNITNVLLSGLIPNTEYKAYFVLESAGGFHSAIKVSSSFTTKAAFDYTLTINDKEWNVEDKYIIGCGEQSLLSVKVETADNDIVKIDGVAKESNEFEITVEKPSVRNIPFVIESQDGSYSETYTIAIEKYFAFGDIVKTMWNNTLMLNLKKLRTEGYTVTGYQWYKNGQPIQGATAASYSAGPKAGDLLDKDATYAVAITTPDGTIHSCAEKIVFKSMQVKAYPNPVSAGETIYIDADIDDELLTGAVIEIYNISGIHMSTVKVTGRITSIDLPASSGVYILKFKANNGFGKDLKTIVK